MRKEMPVDGELFKALITGLLGAGVWSFAVQLLKRPQEKRQTELAENKLLLEQDIAARAEARRDHDELRADLKACYERCDKLEADNDRLRAERNACRDELEARKGLCLRNGNPCLGQTAMELPVVKAG